MEKRTDAQIYIYTHKPLDYGIWDNQLYTPLEVGAYYREPVEKVRDNRGDNMSEWNPILAETTGTYWIWKNAPKDLKYIGTCQYRRRIEFPEDENFDELFNKCDVVAVEPIENCNPWLQYTWCHSERDMKDLKAAIVDLYPDMLQDFERYIEAGSKIFYSNSFILRHEDFDEYCKFLFGIFEWFQAERGWVDPAKAIEDIKNEILDGSRHNDRGYRYQSQLFGFLGERLWTLWVQTKFSRVCLVPYKKYENV